MSDGNQTVKRDEKDKVPSGNAGSKPSVKLPTILGSKGRGNSRIHNLEWGHGMLDTVCVNPGESVLFVFVYNLEVTVGKRNVKFNSGTSTKNFMHGIQVMNSGRFQRFDFGADGNIESYG